MNLNSVDLYILKLMEIIFKFPYVKRNVDNPGDTNYLAPNFTI